MTPADRARLYRRRKAGKLARDATPEEVARALAVHYAPGPAPLVPGMTQAQRKKLRKATGKPFRDIVKDRQG